MNSADTAVPGRRLEGRVIPEFLAAAAEDLGQRTAIRQKHSGTWRTISWQEYGEHVRLVALGLLALGIRPGDRACILGENSPEWLFADIGTLSAGGVSVGVYTTSSPVQVEYILADCQASFVFVATEELYDKVSVAWSRLKDLRHIIVFGEPRRPDRRVFSMEEVQELGRGFDAQNPGILQQVCSGIGADDMATLVYTSGTTGPPKGAMLSHANILYQADTHRELLPIGADDRQVSYLPFSHIGERLLSDYRHLVSGSTVHFIDSQQNLLGDVVEVAPTMFFGVPRIWEKFHAAITQAISREPAWLRRAYATALAAGNLVAERRLAGVRVSRWLRAAHAVADHFLLNRLKGMIGMQRTRYVISGGAPIEAELLKWFFALGLDMRETYGLTESAGVVSIPPPGRRKIGAVGCAMPQSEIRIAADGEIMVRGPQVFLGYFGNQAETAKVLRDGWLYTGDLGRLDEDGFLTVTGRKKDILITAAGKNVSPAEIENQLRFSPYIADAMVVGDGRPYLSCLISLNFEAVGAVARKQGLEFNRETELCHMPEILEWVQAEVDQVNQLFARPEQIRRIRLLDRALQPGDEEMTPTMKLKRNVMERKYQDLIESMYRDR